MFKLAMVLSLSIFVVGCGKAQFTSNRIAVANEDGSPSVTSAPSTSANQPQTTQAQPAPVQSSVQPEPRSSETTVITPPPTPQPPKVSEPKASEEKCVKGKGLTIVYDPVTDSYKDANGDWHVWYTDLLEDRRFPDAAFVASQSIEGKPLVTAFVDGKIDNIKDNAHVGLKGLNASAAVTNLVGNSHVALFAPLSVTNVKNISHLSVYGRVNLGSIDCVSHLYIEHSNMAQFVGKTLYTSWVHIKR